MIKKLVAILLTTSMGAAMAQDDVIGKAAAEKGAIKTDSGMVYRIADRGQRCQPKGNRYGAGALQGNVSGRQGVRQFIQARTTHRISAESCHQVLDRRRTDG